MRLAHQVPVDVVELRGPLPEALHVAHDAAVLRPDHEAPDHAAVVRHVRTQPRPHALKPEVNIRPK